MPSTKLNRNILRSEFNKLGLTKSQRAFYKVNGNSSNIVLKNFLDTYKPPKSVNEYNILRIEARKLGYDEKNGRKKDELINFIQSKAREKSIIIFQELKNNKINNLIGNNKFQEVLDYVVNGQILSLSQFNSLWNKLIGEKYVIELTMDNDGKQSIPINSKTFEFLQDLLTNGFIQRTELDFGSDTLNKIDILSIKDLKISKMKKPKKILQKDGAYFPYINTSPIDLSRFQIYTQTQADNIKNFENCLINCFILAGVNNAIINQIKLSYIKGAYIRKKEIPEMSKIIGRDIHIYTIDNTDKVRIQKITNKFKDVLKICLYENHYFLLEDTIYTKFFITNYDELKDEKDPFNISRIKNVNGKKYFIRDGIILNSLQLIHLLYSKNYFSKLNLSMFEEYESNDNKIYLDNIENEQKLFEDEENEYVIKNEEEEEEEAEGVKNIYYADCEAYVNKKTHSLFLLGAVSSYNDCVNIWKVNNEVSAKDVVYRFLNYLTKGNDPKDKIICYFHNLKYDYHILEPYLNMTGKVLKDNQVYSIKLRFFSHNIELRDSYKLIPEGLGKFNSIFDLDKEFGKKEAIAFKYYTPENYGERVNVNDYRNLLKEKDKSIFDEIIKTEVSFDNMTNTFDPLSYYLEYLRLDCLTLKKGLEKFNSLILEITKDISIYDCLTISSLTDKYMIKNGAYNNVYCVKGNLREYISKAVYGGRVCVNEKYKKKIVEGQISDYDGVSLYPSAINRLCREMGLPTGEAKRLNGKDYKNFKYSILSVKINKVNKFQQIPFIAHKGDGVIEYLNEAPKDIIIIDSITLEDYIKFHNIDFEVVDGVYWEGEFNKKMGELVQTLFLERLKYKKSKPALAQTIKLMLNSSYGKTIMKKSNVEVKIIKNEKRKDNIVSVDDVFNTYVYNNFRTIKSFRKVNENNYEIERLKVDDTYNRGHIGCAILSMSKRIMNEVFDIANDNKLPIYYTDTDSIHLNLKDVKPLEDKYREIYGKELNGKNLEQFHTDFSLDGAVDEIYATKSIFLGKKSYLDCLESRDKDGNKITGYHIRLKGITEEGLDNQAKKYSNSFEGMYEELAIGKELNILLNPKDKVLFEYKKGFVNTKADFYRKVKF